MTLAEFYLITQVWSASAAAPPLPADGFWIITLISLMPVLCTVA